MNTRIVPILVLLISLVFSSARSGAEVVLVRDGVSVAPIVLFDSAPPLTLRAAEELADYIERTSGARPEILHGEPQPRPASAIWVGYQPVLDGIFPDLDFAFARPEEILIAANDRHLVIAGRDRWNPDALVVDLFRRTIDGVQIEYGTANAVYTFLQDFLGVRWLWPGESGIDVVPQQTIAFPPFEYRYVPQFRDRSGLFRLSKLGDSRAPLDGLWTRYQRLQLDSMEIPGGHGFTDWWERFGSSHPEYFALQPNGKRDGFPDPKKAKICVSNPAVWDQWLRDVEAELERNPNKVAFDAEQNDSYHRGHCICENCQAWDNPNAPTLSYVWEGLSQRYVAIADRYVTFANILGKLLREKYPDEDYYVRIGAYGNWLPAPVEAVPADNVLVSVVANFHNRTFQGNHPSGSAGGPRQTFLEWGGIAPNMVWRPNLGGAAGRGMGLPGIGMREAMRDMREVAENNTIGLFFDTLWENWATMGPYYYILGQLAWNPYADGEAILDDYYNRAFGPAVEPMRDYWTRMETSARNMIFDDAPMAGVWDAEFINQQYALLDQAAERVKSAPEIYTQRLDFVRAGLDYTRLILDLRESVGQLRTADTPELRARIRANWEAIDVIRQAHPFALNWIYSGPGRGNVRGLYPDFMRE